MDETMGYFCLRSKSGILFEKNENEIRKRKERKTRKKIYDIIGSVMSLSLITTIW